MGGVGMGAASANEEAPLISKYEVVHLCSSLDGAVKRVVRAN
jgi:hypothetical protein